MEGVSPAMLDGSAGPIFSYWVEREGKEHVVSVQTGHKDGQPTILVYSKYGDHNDSYFRAFFADNGHREKRGTLLRFGIEGESGDIGRSNVEELKRRFKNVVYDVSLDDVRVNRLRDRFETLTDEEKTIFDAIRNSIYTGLEDITSLQ